jgi:hypothetical protein
MNPSALRALKRDPLTGRFGPQAAGRDVSKQTFRPNFNEAVSAANYLAGCLRCTPIDLTECSTRADPELDLARVRT